MSGWALTVRADVAQDLRGAPPALRPGRARSGAGARSSRRRCWWGRLVDREAAVLALEELGDRAVVGRQHRRARGAMMSSASSVRSPRASSKLSLSAAGASPVPATAGRAAPPSAGRGRGGGRHAGGGGGGEATATGDQLVGRTVGVGQTTSSTDPRRARPPPAAVARARAPRSFLTARRRRRVPASPARPRAARPSGEAHAP